MKQSATLLLAAIVAPLFAAVASAQQTCNETSHCGQDHQCCSEFGFCSDEFCRGGCSPYKSFLPTSCKPLPICEAKTYTFTDLSRIVNETSFDGNVTKYDFTLDNAKLAFADHIGISDGALALFLTEENGGARISTTRNMYYGRATATMKVGHWDGVITSFITMSNVHDEIDWEWPGQGGAAQGQSNYFWEGVIIPKGGYHNLSSDGFANYHDFTIDWQPDRLNWEVDGKVVRTLRRDETFNQTTGLYEYPQTPSRVQFSLWPAGISSSAPGTIEWSGGMIDWNDAEYKAAGHFYALLKKLEVTCYSGGQIVPPADALSYVYGNETKGVPTINFSNQTAMDAAPGMHLSGLRSLAPLVAALGVASAALLL